MRSVRVGTLTVLVLGAAVAFGPVEAKAASLKVKPAGEAKPGEFVSIQAAIDAAAPGDSVIVFPGDYTEPGPGPAAVRITKSLKLIAKSKLKKVPPVKVRILPGPGQNHGILVEPDTGTGPVIDKIMIKGFTVEGFPNNGIQLRYTSRFKLIGNESIDNLENGIFPTLSAKGLVKKNVSYGSEDSALWVESSDNVKIIKNELAGAPTGLEITVSTNILAKKNDIHDNTVGVGLYHANGASLPPGPDDGDYRIEKNHIHDNNLPNPAPAGSFSAALPPGIGLLALGVNRVSIKKNVIENNNLTGAGILDWCFATSLALPGSGVDCTASPAIVDPSVNGVEVVKNDFIGNGAAPPAGFGGFEGDVIFFPFGIDNCFADNTPAVLVQVPPSSSAPLPVCMYCL